FVIPGPREARDPESTNPRPGSMDSGFTGFKHASRNDRVRRQETGMPIYQIDGQAPEFPAEGDYWVAETATLIGRVRLKRDASVWFGAVLRGDNEWIELGERSQIQDNATLHTDPGFPMVIGEDCVIGHKVMLHGCTVGDNTLIGMGAIITERKTFPDTSMIVGAPARVIRHVDEKMSKMIAGGADI